MVCERTSAGLAAARAEGRIGGRRKKLDDTKRREIVEAAMSGRKTAAQMARMFGVSPPTVSRIVAAHVAGAGVIPTTSTTASYPRPIR
jgi:DNA invertase Pin-like site-specific DNA recombinase